MWKFQKVQQLMISQFLKDLWKLDIIMHQLKSSYNSLIKDPYSHPIHTRFAMIASNEDLKLFHFSWCKNVS